MENGHEYMNFSGEGGDEPMSREEVLMRVMRQVSEQVENGSPEEALGAVSSVIGTMLQLYHDDTHDITFEVKTALGVLGYGNVARRLKQVMITLLANIVMLGANTHAAVGEEIPPDVMDHVILAVLSTHGIKAEVCPEHHGYHILGSSDWNVEAQMEEEVAKFAAEVEAELGESTEEPGKRGWW